MHPPRRNGASDSPKLADRLADWLLTHIPLSTLTLLTLLVTSPLDVPKPRQVFVVAGVVDFAINLVRWRHRAKRHVEHAARGPIRRRAAA